MTISAYRVREQDRQYMRTVCADMAGLAEGYAAKIVQAALREVMASKPQSRKFR
jgi:hypothetical protein